MINPGKMKRKDLQKIADKYTKSLEKSCDHIPGSFAVDDIHDLRVDYKRLRAFIRLCSEEDDARKAAMPDKLRDVYKAAGKVRDAQLFLAKVTLFAKVEYAIPEFTQCLQQELFRDKECLVKKIEDMEWHKLDKSIHSELPSVLHDAAIRAFVNRKVAAIHILLLAAERAKDLHEIRKNLKDLLHVTRVFENDYDVPFPYPAWKDEKAIDQMTDQLGEFNDDCITLSFLECACTENLPESEQHHIATWKNMQSQQVENNKKRLLQEIHRLELTSPHSLVN